MPEVVAPDLDKARPEIPFVKAVEADDAHLGLSRGNLAVGCLHIVGAKDDVGKHAQANSTRLANNFGTDKAQLRVCGAAAGDMHLVLKGNHCKLGATWILE